MEVLDNQMPKGIGCLWGVAGEEIPVAVHRSGHEAARGVPALTPVGNRATSREAGSSGRVGLLLDVLPHNRQRCPAD